MEDLLEKIISKRAFKPLDVPEWADCGTFTLRRLTVGDMALFRKYNPTQGVAAWILVLVGDSKGNRAFKETDLPRIAEIDLEVVTRIVDEGIEYNGLKGDSADTKKNSKTTENSNSSLCSPSSLAAPSQS